MNGAPVDALPKRQESEAQAWRVAALREHARVSRLRFDNGYGGSLADLYAENALFSAALTAVRSQAERDTQLVTVFQAAGGGWIAGSSCPPSIRRVA